MEEFSVPYLSGTAGGWRSTAQYHRTGSDPGSGHDFWAHSQEASAILLFKLNIEFLQKCMHSILKLKI